jgi:hypothetical protein
VDSPTLPGRRNLHRAQGLPWLPLHVGPDRVVAFTE